ncbi:MAG: succinate dehydrogenase, cytochrome b556 subunit [Gammaproteobacteria bacterium]
MSSKPHNRPMSPYMLGPYYKFQITSLLSITGRLTGLFWSFVTLPLAIAWLWCLAAGPEALAGMNAFLGGWIGQLLLLLSALCVWFHTLNGLRHLVWDTGRGFEKPQIRASGMAVLAGVAVMTVLTWWAAS